MKNRNNLQFKLIFNALNRIYGLIGLCCLLLSASSWALDNVEDTEAVNIQPKSFFKDTTIWPEMDIPVCWERQEAPKYNNTFENRVLVRNAIKQSWEKESLVRFKGWDWYGR